MFEWVLGTRACDTKTRKVCLAQGRFKFLANRKVVPGWKAGQYSRQWADSVHRCMNYPTAYRSDYQFDLPLKYAGNMNSHQTIMFMLAFCEYFFSFCDLFKPYYHLFCRFAHDLRYVMSPYLKKGESMRYQILHVAETCGLLSAMMPDCQQPFVFHQFLEITSNMQVTGPARGTACFTGERFMGKLAQAVTEGGQKYIISIMRRIVSKERANGHNRRSYNDKKFPFVDNSVHTAIWC